MNNKNLAEMIIHIPLCTHSNIQRVLFLGEVTKEITEEFAKHQVCVDYFLQIEEVMALNERIYDVVIFKEQKPDEIILANLEKIINNDAVFVFGSSFYKSDLEGLKADLNLVGKNFWIAMPYSFDENCCILASKKYHPTADLLLQKSDLLDGLDYYSSEIALSAFTFPAFFHRALTGIAKR